jgi:hypothetical protein
MAKMPNLDVYLKENVPSDFHYNESERIGNFIS